jgi:UDP-N-acetylmuramate: L-alanyl-gamma-D-glutamyl-meso-diaminopimelate ligase
VQAGLDGFQGIKRRQEVRGVVRDITVIDDFAHHPTAVRETLQALKAHYSDRKLWAVFEPRSNTSRTKVFQAEFPAAFDGADEILLAPPYDNGKISRDQLLDVEQISREIQAQGRRSAALSGVNEIVETIAKQARPGDVVAILSNGGFGGIHEKLLRRLEAK